MNMVSLISCWPHDLTAFGILNFLSICIWLLVTVTENISIKEPPRDKTNKMACAPSEESDQPGHPPSLIRVFAVRIKKAWVLIYPLSQQRRLIRLGGCPGWSEPLQGAHAVLLVLSRGRSYEPRYEKTCLREFPTGSDSNWPALLQKLAWGLKFWLQKLDITLSRQRTTKADAQADLRLCCSHMT